MQHMGASDRRPRPPRDAQPWLDETSHETQLQTLTEYRSYFRATAPLLAGMLAVAPAAPASSQARSLPLDPAHAEIGFRAYAFGLVPMDGVFSRFSGVLTIDPAAPAACRVDVRVDVASLHMPDPAIRDDVLSAGLLDAAAFPTMTYSGTCRGDVIDGALTLHGVTRPLNLEIVNSPPSYVAQASVQRRDWGIAGQPLMASDAVRIRVSTTLTR